MSCLEALSLAGVHSAESLLLASLVSFFTVRSYAGLTVPSEHYFCTFLQATLLGCRAALSGAQHK